MERLGKVSEWNDDRGFGFIAPLDGEPARVFFHVRDYRLDGRRPEPGELVKFTAHRQPDGRWRAQAVRRTVSASRAATPPARARTPSARPASRLAGAGAIAAYAVLLAWAVGDDRLAVEALFIPLAMSAITFVAYALDKHAAQTGRWRTPESTLHLLKPAGDGRVHGSRSRRCGTNRASQAIAPPSGPWWSCTAAHCSPGAG